MRVVTMAAVLAMLAGCGGGGGAGNPAIPAAPTAQQGALQIKLTVPSKVLKSVSPSTQSIVVLIGASVAGTFNTTPSSGGCSLVNGSTQCTFAINVPFGSNTFTVNAYDGLNGTGQLLSTGSVVQTIVAGVNVIPLTLSGVLDSIVVALGAMPNAGTATTIPVIVTGKDVDGNIILAPGNYTHPITLTNSDTSGTITTLSATTVAGPGTAVTLSYNGKSIGHATISASATGVAPANVIAGTFAPTPVLLASYHPPNDNIPVALAPGSDGNVWVTLAANGGAGPAGQVDGIAKITPSGSFTEYDAGTTPNLSSDLYQGIATGPDGNLYFTEQNNNVIGEITPAGAVTEFPVGTAPLRIVAGADGAMWFTLAGADSLGRLSVPGHAYSTISLPAGSAPNDIALGADGDLYATEPGTDQIAQVVTSASPVVNQFTVIGAAGGLIGVTGTPDGDIWFTEACGLSSIGRVHPSVPWGSSQATTFPTLVGCAAPAYMTSSPDDSVWFGENAYPMIGRAVVNPAQAAPTLIDYPVPGGTLPGSFAMTVGPDGNIWATNPGPSPLFADQATIVKFGY